MTQVPALERSPTSRCTIMPKAKAPTLLDRMSNAAILVALEPLMDGSAEFEALRGSPPFYSWTASSEGTLLNVSINADDKKDSSMHVLHKGHSIAIADFNAKGGNGFVNYGERRIPTALVEGELMDFLREIVALARENPGESFSLAASGPKP
jgi:hypothetical protein